MITKQYIQLRDNQGTLHKWLIEEETENTYKIFCNGFISEIYKKNTYWTDEGLHSLEIRNPFRTLENRKYAKAEFCEIKLNS